jgi:HTH-type transcriptional regulator / antitoxin HigA
MMIGSDIQRYGELLSETLPRTIRSEAEAEQVQKRINDLIDRRDELGKAESELLSLLGDLIIVWEGSTYDLQDIYGVDAVKVLIRERGFRQATLVGPVFQTSSLASEVLSGKRALSYEYVERLSRFFGVSPAVFFPDTR